MILDHLKNWRTYSQLNILQPTFQYLDHTDLGSLAPGRHEIDGERCFALAQEYEPALEGKWEAHRHYIDVQYMIAGCEQIGYAAIHQLAAGEYDPGRDFLPLSGEGGRLTLSAGMFVVFFPQDAHMPGLGSGTPGRVKKVVLKVLANP